MLTLSALTFLRIRAHAPQETLLSLLLLLVKLLDCQHGKYRKKLLFRVSVKQRPTYQTGNPSASRKIAEKIF